jgi:hypothetical protein
MSDQPTPPTDPAARIAELEAKLARVTYERNLLKSIVTAKPPGGSADWDVTEEEIQEAVHGPRGISWRELLAEFEQKPEGR